MTYHKGLLLKWLEMRADVFVNKCAGGIFTKTITVEEVRKEFRIIAHELGPILEEAYEEGRRDAVAYAPPAGTISNAE